MLHSLQVESIIESKQQQRTTDMLQFNSKQVMKVKLQMLRYMSLSISLKTFKLRVRIALKNSSLLINI